MKLALFLAAGTAAYAIAGAAGAADSWSGYHVGVSAGYAFGNVNAHLPGYTDMGNWNFPVSPYSTKWSLSGGAVGLDAGRDWQRGHVVFGLDASANYVGAEGEVHTSAFGTDPAMRIKTDFIGDLRGRVGYASGPWLIYGIGGGSAVVARERGVLNSVPTKAGWGWSAGGGVERQLGHGLAARAEYDYTSFEISGHDVIQPTSDSSYYTVAPWPARYRIGLNRLTVGVSKRF
jgi:outer membrane immunogenic protein